MHVVSRLLVALAVACCCAAAGAAGQAHEQQLAAELVVLGGDLRRLTDEPVGKQEHQGLEQRIAGALASLPLALRRAGADAASASELRNALSRRSWRTLAASVERLKRRHPIDTRRLLAASPTPEALTLAASIHASICAACHDTSWGDVPLPARNLAAQAKSMPREEFAARLLLGVRGTREHAYANPFSDDELAALIAWYAR